jgi:hypothetical protein
MVVTKVDMIVICSNKFDSGENLDKNKLPPRNTTVAIAILSNIFVNVFVIVRYRMNVINSAKKLAEYAYSL